MTCFLDKGHPELNVYLDKANCILSWVIFLWVDHISPLSEVAHIYLLCSDGILVIWGSQPFCLYLFQLLGKTVLNHLITRIQFAKRIAIFRLWRVFEHCSTQILIYCPKIVVAVTSTPYKGLFFLKLWIFPNLPAMLVWIWWWIHGWDILSIHQTLLETPKN